MQSHKKYPECNHLAAERPLSSKKFAALMAKMRSGELKLADIEVPAPSLPPDHIALSNGRSVWKNPEVV
jgi:hypothetical protein